VVGSIFQFQFHDLNLFSFLVFDIYIKSLFMSSATVCPSSCKLDYDFGTKFWDRFA